MSLLRPTSQSLYTEKAQLLCPVTFLFSAWPACPPALPKPRWSYTLLCISTVRPRVIEPGGGLHPLLSLSLLLSLSPWPVGSIHFLLQGRGWSDWLPPVVISCHLCKGTVPVCFVNTGKQSVGRQGDTLSPHWKGPMCDSGHPANPSGRQFERI